MKKFLRRMLILLLCGLCACALADGTAVTVYGPNGTQTAATGVACEAVRSVHCYSGPSTSYDYLGTWDADGNTSVRALTLAYGSRNEDWVLVEIREGSISRVYGYVQASELSIPDSGALVREADLYDLMYMQCLGAAPNVTCRVGPGKEFSASAARIESLQGTILLTANGFALVETWSDNSGSSRVWVRTSDLIY